MNIPITQTACTIAVVSKLCDCRVTSCGEITRLEQTMVSLWNLTDPSATLLSRHLSNFRTMEQFGTLTSKSWLRDFEILRKHVLSNVKTAPMWFPVSVQWFRLCRYHVLDPMVFYCNMPWRYTNTFFEAPGHCWFQIWPFPLPMTNMASMRRTTSRMTHAHWQ